MNETETLRQALAAMVAVLDNVHRDHPDELWLGSEYQSARQALAGPVDTDAAGDAAYIAAAREQYAIGGEIEVDDDAEVSVAEEGLATCGAWVQAWVWVDRP